MFKVTRFCVQPFVKEGGRVVPSEPSAHFTRDEALRLATTMRRRVSGVAVYEVTGWPVYDLWGAPKLISRAGEVLEA